MEASVVLREEAIRDGFRGQRRRINGKERMGAWLAIGERSFPNSMAVVSQVRSYSGEILGHGDFGPAWGSLANIGQFEQWLSCRRGSRFNRIQVHQRALGPQHAGTQLLELLFGRNQLLFQVLDLSVS